MNKKSIIILKISILSVLALFLLSVMMFFLSGTHKRYFFLDLFKFDNSNYSLVKTLTYSLDEVKSFNIDLVNADFDVRYSDTDSIRIEIYDRDENTASVNVNNGVLNVNFNKISTFCIGFCFSSRRMIMYLPDSFKGDMKVSSASGDINILDFAESNMTLTSISGDIDVVSAKSAEIKTTSGEITIRDVNDLKVSTMSGDIEIQNVNELSGDTISGSLEVYKLMGGISFSTTSGDIELNKVTLSRNSKLSTVSGDVEIESINPVYVSTSTISGDVDVRNSDRRSDIELNIKTTSGDIEIK